MDAIDQLLANNRAYAQSHNPGQLVSQPQLRVAVVTCMDARIDVYTALGLQPGEAHVMRNAGGVVTDDMIRSLAISQRKLGTREVMLIHHSDCGMAKITEEGFRAELLQELGVAPPFAIEAFVDADENVRQSLRRVLRSEFVPHRDVVRGFVYDVQTRALREISAD